MKYIIREAKYEDAEGIARVSIQAWKETYAGIISDEYLKNISLQKRTQNWKNFLEKERVGCWDFVIEAGNGEIIGFISGGEIRTKVEDYKGELYAIYILKEHQGNSLGYLLLQKLCSVLKENGILNMSVLVLEDNLTKNFYMKYGAKLIKKIPEKIGEQNLIEEVYGWDDFSLIK